jgi:hypothetical protein
MAISASYCKRNSAVKYIEHSASATQSVDYSDRPGEKVIIIVDNQNTADGKTASITVEKGDYLASIIGDMPVEVGSGEKYVIGPLETVRFKNTSSEVVLGVSVTASGTLTDVKIGVVKLP